MFSLALFLSLAAHGLYVLAPNFVLTVQPLWHQTHLVPYVQPATQTLRVEPLHYRLTLTQGD
jgi:hypothetical protein